MERGKLGSILAKTVFGKGGDGPMLIDRSPAELMSSIAAAVGGDADVFLGNPAILRSASG